jgi:hypothetical protein
MTVEDIGQKLTASFLVVAVLFDIFIYCYGGQVIMEKSSQICKECYKLDREFLIIMARVQNEIKIENTLFHASLETFGDVLTTSWGYISVMKSWVK